ncbi:MAG: M56 family metallopeptidase, partial [Sphingobacteriales bacterium]
MLNFVITSAISLAALLAVYYLLLQREKMHRFNRVYLLASVIFSMALPFISIPIYVAAQAINPIAVPQPDLPVMHMSAEVPVSAIAETPQADYAPYVIWGLYGIITLVLLFRFGKNLWRFKVLVTQNETLPHQNATLVLVDDTIVPYTFLNYIFINKEAYTARRIAPELFAHELAHVTQRHTLDILLIESLKTVLWFNPLLYACRHAIQLNHEFLADESALKQSTDIITYQQLLLQHISPKNTFALASSLNFGITKKRFTMMTKTTQKNRALLLKLAALPVLAGLVFALSTKTIAQQPLPPKATNGMPLQDSIAYKKKRDAYYSGVKVVIDDQANNVYIN